MSIQAGRSEAMRKSRKRAGMRDRKNRISKQSLKEKVSGAIDLPPETLSDLAQIQIVENREVMIEGYKSILEYDDNMIRLKTKNMQLSFWGSKLVLRCMNDDNIIISGSLERIEFYI